MAVEVKAGVDVELVAGRRSVITMRAGARGGILQAWARGVLPDPVRGTDRAVRRLERMFGPGFQRSDALRQGPDLRRLGRHRPDRFVIARSPERIAIRPPVEWFEDRHHPSRTMES